MWAWWRDRDRLLAGTRACRRLTRKYGRHEHDETYGVCLILKGLGEC